MDRRSFLAAGGGAVLARAQAATVRLGIIGCGWWGGVNLRAAYQAGGVQCVALCDVDSKMLDDMAALVEKQEGRRPKLYKHYEEMLDAGGLDAVILATPPQWHALPFLAATRRKVAIYAEKPLAYDVRECRAMADAWKKAGNVVQVGFQRRQSEAFRAAGEYIRSGAAGRVVQVDVNIHYTAQPLDNTPQPPPPTLDWDLWCGPAPLLPYSPNVGHRAWRLEETTGHGHLVDWGIHLIDATRVMLGLGMPKKVAAAGGIYHFKGRITTPDTLTAHFEFDQCPVVWRHRLWGAVERDPEFSNGVTVFCEKETVFVTDQRWIVFSRGKDAPRRVQEIQPPVDLSRKHMEEFLACVRASRPAPCTPEDALRSTATVKLGMIAYKAARTIEWDEKGERILNDPAAHRMLKRDYRAPYKHPWG
ncbi:MAG: Gfo/Idh/MocA family oxidoreductase [Bryobacteraceae bacterium]|nr:Gfo/Idh/MocA family oxidoreductase [Bryobacteraceae bacterium]